MHVHLNLVHTVKLNYTVEVPQLFLGQFAEVEFKELALVFSQHCLEERSQLGRML